MRPLPLVARAVVRIVSASRRFPRGKDYAPGFVGDVRASHRGRKAVPALGAPFISQPISPVHLPGESKTSR